MKMEDPRIPQAQSDRFLEAAKLAGSIDDPALFIASLKAIASKDDHEKANDGKHSSAEELGS